MELLDLPIEVRIQIWSYVVQPLTIYPCECALKDVQCTAHRFDPCCLNTSTYEHCDNRILRVNQQVYEEVRPLVQKAEQRRTFVLCNNLCLDNFYKRLFARDWRWVNHLRVDLFVGIGTLGQDDWFICQNQRWARRYVLGALEKYTADRKIVVVPDSVVREDKSRRRTLTVDIFLT